jgi:SAM-dependent methyltransferase/uncharacterized protein YbaR (Trm112 family)
MDKLLLDALRCPFCSGKFTVTNGDEQTDNWEYAVLSCYCDRYPVVAGIPILRKGMLGAKGETTRTVSQFIESGKNQEAFLAMAVPPKPASAELAPAWLERLPQVKGMWRLKELFGRFAISRWTELAQDFLTAGPQGKTAKDYIDFYFFGSRLQKTQYSYFINRFGQPRHLVALSLMTLIESPRKPVLDFGCGFGHLTRHLPRRVGHQAVIGADYDFMRLYVSKKFVAPDALYVCCDGDASLPFINEFFSVVYTSDALYMVTNKAICSREIQRVVDSDGLIIVAGLRNGLVNTKTAIPYYTYGKLFDRLPHRLLANSDVLDRYLNKQGPAISRSSEKRTLEDEPWFSIVATKREELLVDRGPFADWPHAEGQLELNPLYKLVGEQRDGSGKSLYRHTFPSDWYEQEDGDCRKYEPESVAISSGMLKDLSSGKRTAEMEDLIAQCVIVGIPDRFH